MFTTQLTAEQRLGKAVVDIMANPKYVALAGVMMIGERSVDDSVPTACTNGRDELYGRAFIESLNDKELRFLILHETYHKLYRHLTTWKWMYDDDADCANQACDYVINLKIVDDNAEDKFAVMPECGLIDRRFDGMDSAQVFNIIKQEKQNNGGSGNGDGDGAGEQSAGGQAGSDTGNGSSGGFDSHDWESAQQLSDAEQRELARDIDEAVRQGALAAGKLGSGGNRDLAELLEPQVDWREVLREFISTTCSGNDYSTWARPNRRYRSAGVYLPTGISQQVGELVVAIDTSGSIGSRELASFMSEVKSVCETVQPEKLRILYWDTRVAADETYDMHELDTVIQSTKPAGGGGTDATCVPDYLKANNINAQACIMFTDGYVFGWGQWHLPVLWTILDNKSATPDVGKTVHVQSRDM